MASLLPQFMRFKDVHIFDPVDTADETEGAATADSADNEEAKSEDARVSEIT